MRVWPGAALERATQTGHALAPDNQRGTKAVFLLDLPLSCPLDMRPMRCACRARGYYWVVRDSALRREIPGV